MIIDEANAFEDTSVEAQSRIRENYLHGKRLRVAVLGPNLDDVQEVGTLKRYQIRDALKDVDTFSVSTLYSERKPACQHCTRLLCQKDIHCR